MNGTVKYKKFQLLWVISFVFSYVSEFVFSHSTTSRVFLLFFFAMSFIRILIEKNKPNINNSFLIIYVLFTIICFINVKLGLSIEPSVSMNRIQTLFLNILYLWFLGKFYTSIGKDLFCSILVKSTLYADIGYVIVSSILNRGIALRGEANISNANTLAVMTAFCICIVIIQNKKDNKKINSMEKIMIAIFIVFCLLSGSRKSLFLLGIAYLVYLLFTNSKIKLLKIFRLGIIILISYFAIMNINILYETIGNRVEGLLEFLNTGEGDSSINTRNHFIELGLEYIKLKPIYGYGLDCFQLLRGSYGKYSHNNYIELMFSVGVLGTMFFYLNHIIILANGLKNRKQNNDCLVAIILILCVLFIDYGLVSYYSRGILIIVYFCSMITKKSSFKINKTRKVLRIY